MTTRIETEDVVELQPCPFCGGSTKEFPIKDGHIVQCVGDQCRANPQMWGRSRAAAIANWNTRSATPIERLREENARLREMLSMFVDAAKPRGCDGYHEMPRFSAREIELARAALTPSADDDK